MGHYDLNRSIRLVFTADELKEIRNIACKHNMSAAEFCKGLVMELLKYDSEMKEKKDE